MNKTISMATKSGKRETKLEKKIRRQFLGRSSSIETQIPDLRVVLYSHDTMGVGHMRRNLLIACSIKKQFPNASILTIAGAKEASTFAQIAGIDCLTLPSFQKRANGTYTSRNLGIPAEEILNFRGRTILTALQCFQPDLLIADKVPSGAGGELLPSLEWMKIHSSCHCVLGLRDILDTAEKVRLDWEKAHSFEIIRKYFETVWIYGDQRVYDPVSEYGFPDDIGKRVDFTGYLDPRLRLRELANPPIAESKPFVLCTVGGGQDGDVLPINFVKAIQQTGQQAILLTGPYMPFHTKSQVMEAAKEVPSLKTIDFVSEGDVLLKQASQIVSMGGYNTLSAILSYQKPALIVPRVTPRKEQLIRANRLADLGFVDAIHPDDLTPDGIVRWLRNSRPKAGIPNSNINMHGLEKICGLIQAKFPTVKLCTNEARSE